MPVAIRSDFCIVLISVYKPRIYNHPPISIHLYPCGLTTIALYATQPLQKDWEETRLSHLTRDPSLSDEQLQLRQPWSSSKGRRHPKALYQLRDSSTMNSWDIAHRSTLFRFMNSNLGVGKKNSEFMFSSSSKCNSP